MTETVTLTVAETVAATRRTLHTAWRGDDEELDLAGSVHFPRYNPLPLTRWFSATMLFSLQAFDIVQDTFAPDLAMNCSYAPFVSILCAVAFTVLFLASLAQLLGAEQLSPRARRLFRPFHHTAAAFAIALPLHALLFPYIVRNTSLLMLAMPAALILLDYALGSALRLRLPHAALPVLLTLPNVVRVSAVHGFELDVLLPTGLVAVAACAVFLLSQVSTRFRKQSPIPLYQPIH